jgi:hypothetical protein
VNDDDVAATTEPARTAPSVPSRTRSRRAPSPRRPITGVATTPTSSVSVSIHCAVSSDTCWSAAMVGMSGVPRVDCTETVIPASTSAAVRTRALGLSARDDINC